MTGLIFLSRFRLDRRLLVGGLTMAPFALSFTSANAQTPAASPAPSVNSLERLRDLLSVIPAQLLDHPDPYWSILGWVDFASHLDAMGVRPPDLFDGEHDVFALTGALNWMDPMINWLAQSDEVKLLFGFSLLDVEQSLSIGQPPGQVLVYRGGIVRTAIETALLAAGYEEHQGSYPIWSKSPEGEIDLNDPASRMTLGVYGNIAFIDDETIACFRMLAAAQAFVAALDADEPTIATDSYVSEYLDTLDPATVNIMAVPGLTLGVSSLVPENPGREGGTSEDELLAESDDAVGPMPPIRSAVISATAGAMGLHSAEETSPALEQGNHAIAAIQLATDSAEDAAQIARVATWRFQNMVSPTTGTFYADWLSETGMKAEIRGNTLAHVQFDKGWMNQRLGRLFFQRDMWPFAWSVEP